MVLSKAQSVADYLAELPDDRRKAIAAVRKEILKNLPKGYEEGMQYGMIGYSVPLKRYPQTYNGQALNYVALAAQKNHMAIYLMGIYGDDALRAKFEKAYRESGKKLDAGKSCVRFKTLEDLPLDVIGEAVAALSVEDFIALHEKARGGTKKKALKAKKK
jgi:hypothetical protein